MIPQGNSILDSAAGLLGFALTLYMWIVIIRAIISWVNPSPYNPFVQFLAKLTDPPLVYIRRHLPFWVGGIDFSPVVLILVLIFLNDFLVLSLKAIARDASISILLPIFFSSIINLVRTVLMIYMILIIARAVLSWISPDPSNPIVGFIYGVTEPVLGRIRRVLPLLIGGFDLTPIVVIAGIYLIMRVLDQLMFAVRGML
ncbi:MAG: YggT family protein [Deltaproteobacteria bacterium]|nr:YggT family protein [Deltaproteobacteria bacterium]MBW2050880.1 YggT family protein [Deltaproteobacteria bacterium]MBW2141722.1 YggT family protein [Deltaproteobacteria bacterium]MBW2322879.1 YggT family protein [Deltaproteobacteria bacterium]